MSDWTDETIDWYAAKYGDDPSVLAVVAAAGIAAGADVLDVGCGTGSALRALVGHAGRLTGVDPFERMIGHARVLRPGGRIVIGGEVFGEGMVPGGQDYRATLAAHGFVGAESKDIEGGFAISAVKEGRA